jgi:hypothetical protein
MNGSRRCEAERAFGKGPSGIPKNGKLIGHVMWRSYSSAAVVVSRNDFLMLESRWDSLIYAYSLPLVTKMQNRDDECRSRLAVGYIFNSDRRLFSIWPTRSFIPFACS